MTRPICLIAALCVFAAACVKATSREPQPLATATDRQIDWPRDTPQIGQSPAVSSDGRFLAYVAETPGDVHVRDLVTGRDRTLTRFEANGGRVDYPSISNSGRFIAFFAEEKGRQARGLYIGTLTDSGLTDLRLLIPGPFVIPLDWSADDSDIFVVIEREDRTIDLAIVTTAGALRVVKKLPRHPRTTARRTPDGAFIAYDLTPTPPELERDVYLVSTKTGDEITLLTGPSSDTVVGWSASGQHLVFASDRQGSRGLWTLRVTDGRPSGEPSVLRVPFFGAPIGLTNTGSLVYEAQAEGPNAAVATATMDSAAGSIGPSTFVEADRTRNHRFPRWSHDGRQLMWVTSRAPRWELSVRELTTGKVTTAALDLGYIWTFDWSPDGSIVVFRAERNGSTGLHLVDVRSGAARTLAVQTPTRGLYHPRFTADGSAMTVVRAEGPRDQTRQWSYVAVDVKSGEQRVLRSDLAELMAGSGTHPMTPSPDGRYLLSMTYPGPPSIIRVLETANGQVRDLLRGDRSQAFNHDGYVQWLPGGNAFLTTMRGASRQELWLVPVDGGKPRLIDLASTRFSSDLHALRPDGREVAFVTAPQPPGGLSGLRILEGLLRTIR